MEYPRTRTRCIRKTEVRFPNADDMEGVVYDYRGRSGVSSLLMADECKGDEPQERAGDQVRLGLAWFSLAQLGPACHGLVLLVS